MSNDFDYDDDDAPAPRRSKRDRAKARPSPLRWISPGTFGAAAILFFLPWTDLSCNGPTGKMQLVTQSGYESAVGEGSEGEGFSKLREMGPMGGGNKADVKFDFKEIRNKGPAGKANTDKEEKAPLLWVYLVLLVAGAIVPVLVAQNQVRGAIILGLVGFAILLLVLQMILGFPLANMAADFNKEIKDMGDLGKGGMGPDLKLGGKMEMKSSYLMAFWGSILLLVASGALGLVQIVTGAPKRARAGRSRRLRDDPEE